MATDHEADGRTALDRAIALYGEMADTLIDRLRRLKEDPSLSLGPDGDDLKLLRQHQQAVLMVLHFEAQLSKRRPALAGGAGVLDLAAARAEVLSLLARLEAARDPEPAA